MTFPLSMLLGPLAKKAGLNVPSAYELWQNRQRGPVGSPAYYQQKNQELSNLGAPGYAQYNIKPTNTPFGIQNSDPAYWQMPYRDATQRHDQQWAAYDPNHQVQSTSGQTVNVPQALQPQAPGAVAKFLGAPGVPSSSGFDSRGDSSIYAGDAGRQEAIFQAASRPDRAVNTQGQGTTSFYQPGNEQVGTVNLQAKEGPDQPRESGGGKGGK